jgi:hypothetical protein
MALVNPNIAMSYRGVEVPQQNALADYAAVQQIQSGQRQAEVSQMQMQRMRQTDAVLEQVRQVAMKNGGPGDLNEIARAYMGAPDLEMQKFGAGLIEKLRERAEFNEFGKKNYPDLFGGAPAAVAPAAPVNAMAPAVAPDATAAPVNAMAAPARAQQLSPSGKTRQQLEGLIYMAQGNPLYKGMAETAKLELAEMIKPPVRQVVSAGSTVLGPDNQVVFTAPAAAPTPLNVSRLIKERDALPKGDPNIAIYNDAIRKETQFAPRAITNVNLPSQEKAEQVDRGKMLVAEFGDISKAAKLAAKTLPSIDANLSILDKGFSTGFGTETVAAGAKVLAALGVADADKFATNAQVFQAKATEAVLQKQLEQKGPQTESDAQRIDQIGAQLGKTTAGNRFVLTTAKEQLKRDMEQRDFYAKWWQKNKTYDGAEDAWFSGEGGKSLFDRPALKAYAKSAEAAAALPAANRQSLDNIFAPKK